MSNYAANNFIVTIDHDENLSKNVSSCVFSTLNQYNRLIHSLLIEITATEEVFTWLNDLDYFQPHYLAYSVQGSKPFGIGGNFSIKKIEMKSDTNDSENLKVVILAESILK